jgi:cytochrome c oxidase subunit 2
MKAIWLGLACSMLTALLLIPRGVAQSEVHEIKMTAKKYEFSPAEIRVKQGEKVRLLITPTDRDHGFEIKPLGIKTDLKKGQETAVEFEATKSGEFEFHCSDFCGFGHGKMKGKLIVDPAN